MDLVNGENGGGSIMNSIVKPLDFLKEVQQVVEWLEKVDGRDCRCQSSLAVRLEEKFNEANGRILELEGQLTEAQGENGTLKAKLNDMELLAGRYQVELMRLTRELEVEKWKRFDAESRLKKMVEEVAELHASVGELVSNLQEEEQRAVVPAIMSHASNEPVIKREVLEEEDEGLLGDDDTEKIRSMFVDLSSQVQERLQKCEDMQLGTKAEINGILQGLASIQNLMSHEENTRKAITMHSKRHNCKNGVTSAIPGDQKRASSSSAPQAPAPKIQSNTKNPGTIKSILMKRSADGTFKIRRDSQEQEESSNAAKRKRVQFCLDDSNSVIVHTELKENQRELVQNSVNTAVPDPMEVALDDQHQVIHFEVMKERELGRRFYCNCGRNFVSKKLLNRHLSIKLNGKIFNCLMCSKKFFLHESLKKHVQKSHRVKYHGGRFGCRVCGQTFAVYRQLRQHQITHQHKMQR